VNGLTFRWTTQKVFTSAKIDSISAVSAMSKRIVERKNSLTQSFVGWRVQTHSPVFHPKLMTLMDFNVPQGNHTQFLYLLPFTPNTALIELTRFGDVELTQKEAELELKRQMDKIGCNYSVNEVEIGSIPMTTAFDATHRYYPSGSNIIPIGTIAGAIKPTTGYGFKRMYAHAQAIATALANNQPIPTTKRKFRFQFYDALLLFILKKHPEKGKPIFERLFSSQSVPIILKFLDEETTIHEELLIFAKLPIPLFVRSLCYYIFKR
jgi:lycopene beta-cyclase